MNSTPQASIVCGLIGLGIQGSLTPAMHEQEGQAQGLRYVYKKIDLDPLGLGVADLPELLTAAKRMGFAGLNITYPCKQAVIPLLDELSDEARALNAVNTVVIRDGRLIGHNTDCSGFAEGFRRGLAGVPMNKVVQLGAGGAGAAVAHAVLTLGAKHLTVFDIDRARAEELAASLNAHFGAGTCEAGSDLAQAMAETDGLINCTPTGMAKLPGLPLPAELIDSSNWVAEIVYFPFETELLRVARAKGCRTLDGGGMAVFQAVGAFRLFTDIEPDAERMRAHFLAMVNPASA
ncbi:MAG: shikimate dehydrogenase [Pseudomonas sagittaria]|nr:shikimate dehydrogenase [Pseudomonas sagittaria]